MLNKRKLNQQALIDNLTQCTWVQSFIHIFGRRTELRVLYYNKSVERKNK